MIGIETNNVGKSTLSNLINGNPNIGVYAPYPRNRIYRRPHIKSLAKNVHIPTDEYGWYTTPAHRGYLLTAIKECVLNAYRACKNNECLMPDKGLIDEAETFIKNEAGKYQAASGYHDDRILSYGVSEMVRKQLNVTRRSSQFIAQPTEQTKSAYVYRDGKLYWNWDKVEKKVSEIPSYM
jgi:hypothetical protein